MKIENYEDKKNLENKCRNASIYSDDSAYLLLNINNTLEDIKDLLIRIEQNTRK